MLITVETIENRKRRTTEDKLRGIALFLIGIALGGSIDKAMPTYQMPEERAVMQETMYKK